LQDQLTPERSSKTSLLKNSNEEKEFATRRSKIHQFERRFFIPEFNSTSISASVFLSPSSHAFVLDL